MSTAYDAPLEVSRHRSADQLATGDPPSVDTNKSGAATTVPFAIRDTSLAVWRAT
jgi:hypothetical protein